jgi:methionine-rich copper-binding protein CopC
MIRGGLIAVLAALLGLQAAPALAHAQLVEASPRVGNSVPSSPSEIRLTFSEGVEPRLSGIEVTDETGRRVRTGPANTAAGNPAVLVVRLSAPLPPGTYRVTWHVVSVDTHRTQGSFSFQVGP